MVPLPYLSLLSGMWLPKALKPVVTFPLSMEVSYPDRISARVTVNTLHECWLKLLVSGGAKLVVGSTQLA